MKNSSIILCVVSILLIFVSLFALLSKNEGDLQQEAVRPIVRFQQPPTPKIIPVLKFTVTYIDFNGNGLADKAEIVKSDSTIITVLEGGCGNEVVMTK